MNSVEKGSLKCLQGLGIKEDSLSCHGEATDKHLKNSEHNISPDSMALWEHRVIQNKRELNKNSTEMERSAKVFMRPFPPVGGTYPG